MRLGAASYPFLQRRQLSYCLAWLHSHAHLSSISIILIQITASHAVAAHLHLHAQLTHLFVLHIHHASHIQHCLFTRHSLNWII
jgi:hypothetical protein